MFPAALGVAVRLVAATRHREIQHARDRERQQLARDLHDTVAHHVSAIAIQAEGGLALAEAQPHRIDGAVDALQTIVTEASSTLTEMRQIVDALRSDDGVDTAPQRGVDDVVRLAAEQTSGPAINVTLSGDLDDLSATVDAAIYRIAQESITNSVRHAQNATHIDVTITGDPQVICMDIHDDGSPSSHQRTSSGFGLIGMTERAALLGGSVTAGPGPGAGWSVRVRLPRHGALA